MADIADTNLLAPKDIERITGIGSDHPVKQRNKLRSWGIRAEINAKRQVVCLWSWVAAAGLPAGNVGQYLAANDEDDDDIGMNLRGLRGA